MKHTQNDIKLVNINEDQRQVFVIMKKDRIKINADVKVKN